MRNLNLYSMAARMWTIKFNKLFCPISVLIGHMNQFFFTRIYRIWLNANVTLYIYVCIVCRHTSKTELWQTAFCYSIKSLFVQLLNNNNNNLTNFFACRKLFLRNTKNINKYKLTIVILKNGINRNELYFIHVAYAEILIHSQKVIISVYAWACLYAYFLICPAMKGMIRVRRKFALIICGVILAVFIFLYFLINNSMPSGREVCNGHYVKLAFIN